jgi:Mg/Co/Ni transporter MgtE
VLDDQVVDLSGARVVRVNDVHMLHAEGQLIIAHVAVGIRSILRRLGFERPVSALMRWLLDYTLKDSFVTWRNVELVAAAGAPGLLRVSGAPLRLAEIHPADLADIMEQLGARERQELLSRLPLGKAAEALGEVDPELQRALISREQPERAADILEEMPAKEAADVLRDLHQSDVQRIISRMEREAAQDIVTILSHRQESAGGMMATQCIEAKPQQRAAEVLEQVRSVADQVEVLNYAYVLDEEGRLLGVANLRQLMRAAPDSTMQSLMATDVVKVTPRTSVKDVARLFVRYGFRAIPVVDKRNVFLGAVRLMSVLEELSPLFKD